MVKWNENADSRTRLGAVRVKMKGSRTSVTVYGGNTDESLVDLRSPSTHETRLVSPNLPGSLVHVRRLFLRSSPGS